MRYVTAAEMKEIDRRAIEDGGIPTLTLMENAGKAVAEEAGKILDKGKEHKGRVAVFCGYGNNGGDGLVAARHLIKKGYGVEIFFVGKPRSLTPETNSNLESLLKCKVQPKFISTQSDVEKLSGKIKPVLIIDAIFGIGIKGALDSFYIKLIGYINDSGAPVISVDIPSGLDADTGKPLPVAVKATTTVTFGYPKLGFRGAGAGGYPGRLVVADIGFAEGSVHKGGETGNKEPTIRLRKGKKGIIRPGHPWIFKNQILESQTKPGEIVTVQDPDGKFLGRGYYNPRSEISIRLLTFHDEAIDKRLFYRKFEDALKKREHLKSITNAYRAIFSEADSLPGLIVDIYNDTTVFQVMTLGMEKLKPLALEAIRETIKPACIYEKSDSPFRKLEGLKDVKAWWEDKGIVREDKGLIEIFEGKARFLVDIENGHKTGFYLDQRKARLGLEGFCKDKTVLDLFCYTGGFLVSAGLNGARSLEGVDIKEEWLKLARENARINNISEKAQFVRADAFAALKEVFDSGRRFDVVIVDPPSFLKTKGSLASASKGYRELNTLAMKTLSDGGMLATFSCSHNMPNETFSAILKESAIRAGKKITILKRCHQAEDHPIVRAIPETEYLKGYFLRVT